MHHTPLLYANRHCIHFVVPSLPVFPAHFTALRHSRPIYMLTGLRLVLETLDPLPGDRKCFRMINGVLTERTVKEVVPILKTNSDGLKKALDELVKQYKSKQDEMEKWKVCCLLSYSLTFSCYSRGSG